MHRGPDRAGLNRGAGVGRFGQPNSKDQRSKRQEKARKIQAEHRFQSAQTEHGRGQRRGQKRTQSIGKGMEPAHPGVLILGYQHGGGHAGGRDLKGVQGVNQRGNRAQRRKIQRFVAYSPK